VGQGAVHTFAERALRGQPLELHRGGVQLRAWCYVSDLVDGLVAAMEHPAAVGEVLNLGNPDAAVTVRELAARVAAAAGIPASTLDVDKTGAEVLRRVPDIGKARRLIGFAPRVGLDEGLQKTVAWYREQASSGREVAHG
jgi:nucleoside-diphosphate-sugar epimerase